MYTYNQPEQKELRKELRTHGTSAEATMWLMLKGRQVEGRKFRRQVSINNYVLDFYCSSERLCIELDGQPHNTLDGCAHDLQRDEILLRKYNIRTIRFENRDIFLNPDAVLQQIREAFR